MLTEEVTNSKRFEDEQIMIDLTPCSHDDFHRTIGGATSEKEVAEFHSTEKRSAKSHLTSHDKHSVVDRKSSHKSSSS